MGTEEQSGQNLTCLGTKRFTLKRHPGQTNCLSQRAVGQGGIRPPCHLLQQLSCLLRLATHQLRRQPLQRALTAELWAVVCI